MRCASLIFIWIGAWQTPPGLYPDLPKGQMGFDHAGTQIRGSWVCFEGLCFFQVKFVRTKDGDIDTHLLGGSLDSVFDSAPEGIPSTKGVLYHDEIQLAFWLGGGWLCRYGGASVGTSAGGWVCTGGG
jgi:hypothetical protein